MIFLKEMKLIVTHFNTPCLSVQFSHSIVSDSATPWTAARQAVGDAIQPSHPLSSPSPPTFNLSQLQGLFQ